MVKIERFLKVQMPPKSTKKRRVVKDDESPFMHTTQVVPQPLAPPPKLSPKEAKHLAVTLALAAGTTFTSTATGGANWKLAYGKLSGPLEKSELTPVQLLEDAMEGVAESIVKSLARAEERTFWVSADPHGEVEMEGETKTGVAWRFSWRSRIAVAFGAIPLEPEARIQALKPSREDIADMWASMAAEAAKRGGVVRPSLPLGLGFKFGLGLRQPRVTGEKRARKAAAPAAAVALTE